MDDEFSFSTWLRGELAAQKMTIRHLAQEAVINERTLHHYLACDRSPSIMTVNDILNALGKRIEIMDKRRNRLRPSEPITAADHVTPCDTWWYVCPGCRCAIDYQDKFCRHCGQALYWEGIK